MPPKNGSRSAARPKARARRAAEPRVAGGPRLYTLDVFLISGPVTRRFAEKNPVVSRTIRIRGDQKLQDLHYAIFDAFRREEEHAYEFQLGGKGPMDPKAKRYVLPGAFEVGRQEGAAAGRVDETTIDSLSLQVGDRFGYWFDFGDDWWHQVNVEAVEDKVPRGKYPRVARRVGKSPPQYVDWDKEDE